MKTFRIELSVYVTADDEFEAEENANTTIYEDLPQIMQSCEITEVCAECYQTDCDCQEIEDYKTMKRCEN